MLRLKLTFTPEISLGFCLLANSSLPPESDSRKVRVVEVAELWYIFDCDSNQSDHGNLGERAHGPCAHQVSKRMVSTPLAHPCIAHPVDTISRQHLPALQSLAMMPSAFLTEVLGRSPIVVKSFIMTLPPLRSFIGRKPVRAGTYDDPPIPNSFSCITANYLD
jgi:hypothetical protein